MHKLPIAVPFRTILLGTAVLLSFTSAALAQKEGSVDLKKGPWSRLVEYIGTNNYDAVLGDAEVKKALEKILQGHDVDLKKAFEVSSPIKFEGECLALNGNPANQADTDRAYLEACVSGIVSLAVYDNGKISVYTQFKDYQYLSEGMRSWIYFQNKNVDMYTAPKDVQLVIQAQ